MNKILKGMIIFSICSTLLFCNGMPVSAEDLSEEETPANRERQIIVQYRKADPAEKEWRTGISERITSRNQLAPRTELIQLDDNTQIASMVESMKTDADVLYVEENKKLMLHSSPNDPYLAQQWGLSKIDSIDAWGIIPVNISAVVAVIDSGITSTHPDLKNRIASGGKSFIGYGSSSSLSDRNGHGTEVSGIIAAETNNSIGICGVAGTSSVKILPLKTADDQGSSYLSDVIEAIDYAISKDVDVINLSMGSTEPSDIENEAIQRAFQAGIVVVASAGNDENSSYEYPASYDNVISVGSIAEDGSVSYFSNYNDMVDIVAPGEEIYTCTTRGSYTKEDVTGTSFSAPMVSAVAAVLKSIDPTLTPSQIETILTSTAVDYGSNGKDDYYGYGVLNFYNAVNRISPSSAVTSVSINTSSTDLTIGESITLVSSILPSTAINQTVSWASDNTDVATVDSTGLVTAISPGKATITVTTADGGYTASTIVEVYGDVSSNFNGSYWGAKTGIAANKEWLITFNQAVDASTLNQQNIYVTDSTGKSVTVAVSRGSDGKSALITPGSYYQSGQSYYLFIRNICSTGGEELGTAIRMQFTIE